MARIRTIKPEFFKDDELAELGPMAMILFEGLWCLADKEGRLEDRPKRIKAEILPYFDVDVDELLQKLHDAKFILRYIADGHEYIWVIKFKSHQRITGREAEASSMIPAPPGCEPAETPGKQQGNTEETVGTTGKEGKGKEGNIYLVALSPDDLPEPLRSEGFLRAWDEWLTYRRQRKLAKYTETGLKKTLSEIAKYRDPVDAIANSIAKNYNGIYERKEVKGGNNKTARDVYESLGGGG